MKNDHDIFRPRHQPAQMLYDAFQAEASKRKSRSVTNWMDAELQAVWRASDDYARQHGLQVPTLAQVAAAERYASGSADYGAKWAYQVAAVMKSATA